MKIPEKYNIDGEEILFFGNSSSSMDVKFNRVAKIASNYDEIVAKMHKIINDNSSFPSNKDYCSAVAVLLIVKTGIRVGNEDSAEGYMTVPHPESKIKPVFVKTYGLTTLLPEHIQVENGKVKFDFVGKKHVQNTFEIPEDLSKLVIKVLQNRYSPVFNLTDSELTSFVKRETSPYLSTKDFRTFRANVYGYRFIKTLPKPTTKKEQKDGINLTAEYVSMLLNNTPGVVKTSYLDPNLFTYMLGPEIVTKRMGGTLIPIHHQNGKINNMILIKKQDSLLIPKNQEGGILQNPLYLEHLKRNPILQGVIKEKTEQSILKEKQLELEKMADAQPVTPYTNKNIEYIAQGLFNRDLYPFHSAGSINNPLNIGNTLFSFPEKLYGSNAKNRSLEYSYRMREEAAKKLWKKLYGTELNDNDLKNILKVYENTKDNYDQFGRDRDNTNLDINLSGAYLYKQGGILIPKFQNSGKLKKEGRFKFNDSLYRFEPNDNSLYIIADNKEVKLNDTEKLKVLKEAANKDLLKGEFAAPLSIHYTELQQKYNTEQAAASEKSSAELITKKNAKIVEAEKRLKEQKELDRQSDEALKLLLEQEAKKNTKVEEKQVAQPTTHNFKLAGDKTWEYRAIIDKDGKKKIEAAKTGTNKWLDITNNKVAQEIIAASINDDDRKVLKMDKPKVLSEEAKKVVKGSEDKKPVDRLTHKEDRIYTIGNEQASEKDMSKEELKKFKAYSDKLKEIKEQPEKIVKGGSKSREEGFFNRKERDRPLYKN